jgi:hypothetical protein
MEGTKYLATQIANLSFEIAGLLDAIQQKDKLASDKEREIAALKSEINKMKAPAEPPTTE